MKLTLCLFFVFLSGFATANVEISFNNNSTEENYKISPKNVELTDKRGKKNKSLSSAESTTLESQLLEIFWSSKQNKESLKYKCVPYAEIKSGTETRIVCANDRINKNRVFTILNTLNNYFTEPVHR